MKPPTLCLTRFLNGRSQATCTRLARHRGAHRAEHPLSGAIARAIAAIVRDCDRRGVGVEVVVRLTRPDGPVCETRVTGAAPVQRGGVVID